MAGVPNVGRRQPTGADFESMADRLRNLQGSARPYLEPTFNEIDEGLRYYLGPHGYDALGALGGLGSMVLDAPAAIVDATGYSGDAVRSLFGGNLPQAGMDLLNTGVAAAGVLPMVVHVPRERAPRAPDSGSGTGGARPSAQTGRRSSRQGERGIIGTTDLRTLGSLDEAIGVARTEPHLMQDSTGQFIGAPRGVRNIGDLARARANYDRLVEIGLPWADWYRRERARNLEAVGGDPQKASFGARMSAMLSANNTVPGNATMDNQAWNSMVRGQPEQIIHTGAQARNFNRAWQTGVPISLSDKTGVYADNMDPTVPQSLTGTNDIWQARAMGFIDPDGKPWSGSIGGQMHRYMDYEGVLALDRARQRNLGGRSDWAADEIQAAAWVAAKAEDLLKQGRFKTMQEALEEAAKGPFDYHHRDTFNLTSEQIPGRGTGVNPDILDADYAAREAYSNAASWEDPMGRDRLSSDVGFRVLPSSRGAGSFTHQGRTDYNPVVIGRPILDRANEQTFNPAASASSKVIHPGSMQAMEAIQGVRSLTDAQNGGAGNLLMTDQPGKSFGIELGRDPTTAEMATAGQIAGQNGLDVANANQGITLMNLGNTDVPNRLRAALAKAFPGATVHRGKLQSAYVDLSSELAEGNAGQGLATMKVVGLLDNLAASSPRMFNALLDAASIPDKAKANLARMLSYGGQNQRPDYQRMLGILGEGGLRRLYEHAKQYGAAGLPAFAAFALIPENDEPRRPASSPRPSSGPRRNREA